MSDHTLNLTPALHHYVLENSLKELPVLFELRQQTKKMSTSKMQISPEQGQFMQLLVKLIGAKKTLDIGVFTGYSALCVALVLPEDGKIIACDRNVEWTKIAKRFWEQANLAHKIDLQLGDAVEILDRLLHANGAETFDFAFIDADKKNYDLYYEKSLQLVRPGGLIAIDNTLRAGSVADDTNQDEITIVIRKLNKKIHQDSRITMSLLPLWDGLTLVRKN